MLSVFFCLLGALAFCFALLAGALSSLPLVALHYAFAMSVTAALVCLAVLIGCLGAKVLRWVFFLDAAAPTDTMGGRGA